MAWKLRTGLAYLISFCALIGATLFLISILKQTYLTGEADHTDPSLVIEDAFARANGASAKAGAVFLTLKNRGDDADRLIAVQTGSATTAELHTHVEDADGVMQMRPVEGGLEIPAQGTLILKRGGDHIMLMGLTRPLNQGDQVKLILNFEKSGPVTVDILVDLNR